MSIKWWSAIACIIVVANLSTSGSSVGPESREQNSPVNAAIRVGTLPPTLWKESAIFSSTLQDKRKNGTGALLNPASKQPPSGQLPEGQDVASLPESGSGILLGLGVLALFPVARRARLLVGKV